MKRLHSTYFTGKPDIKVNVHMSGPQEVGTDGRAPQEIYDYLSDNENVESVIVFTKTGGILYRRMG